MSKIKITPISNSLADKLQANGIDNPITISGEEAKILLKIINALIIYNTTKGLPGDLVDLLDR